MDIRPILKTDNSYREGVVDWETTSVNVKRDFNFSNTNIYLTQGFIGSDSDGFSISLGREGSDYTAAIIGNILDAKYVAIWKDVPGVLNADPKQIEATEMLPELSYREAIEMSHSGAQIIHPKTMKPLHNKNIPLYVKSFLNPEAEGTVIRKIDYKLELTPVYIIKENQVLITLSPNDFSFIGIKDISFVFELLSKNRFKINLFQQSAIDLNLVADFPEAGFDKIIGELSKYYEIKYNTSLRLVTIRYYTDEAVKNITRGRRVYIEQKSRRTARFVTSMPERD
jgi:aspartate kinase